MQSKDLCITPEFRETPDIEKLGRALLAITIDSTREKEGIEPEGSAQTASLTVGGDNMT